MLRKVIVTERVFVPRDHAAGISAHWEDKPPVEGFFHGFGVAYEEFDGGPGNYTTAIVELEDGSIIEPETCYIKFVEPLK